MPISTVHILKYVSHTMFKWFWTTFSLGAPDLGDFVAFKHPSNLQPERQMQTTY